MLAIHQGDIGQKNDFDVDNDILCDNDTSADCLSRTIDTPLLSADRILFG